MHNLTTNLFALFLSLRASSRRLLEPLQKKVVTINVYIKPRGLLLLRTLAIPRAYLGLCRYMSALATATSASTSSETFMVDEFTVLLLA